MAVFTRIDEDQIRDFLRDYPCGGFQSFAEIAEGTQNSNFHVFTDRGRFILTLLEQDFTPDDIEFFLAYMNCLNASGISCPAVQQRADGLYAGAIAGKPALLLSFLEGKSVGWNDITPDHCRAVGDMVARMHVAGVDFTPARRNREGVAFLKGLLDKIRARPEAAERIEPGLIDWLDREFAWLESHLPLDLPHAAIHADLFPDNVFFKGGAVSGIIDFYYACTATAIYDLAIVINAWCFDGQGRPRRDCVDALLHAYEAVRPLSAPERDAFRAFGRAASMRFLMTRLHDWVFHDPANLVTPRDPRDYINKLKFHQHESII